MELTEERRDNMVIFTIEGRLDSKTSPELDEKVTSALENGVVKVIMDFGGLHYISSAGLRVILKTEKRLKSREGAVILCAMQEYVREVFEIAGFDSILQIVPTLDDAVGAGSSVESDA